MCTMWGHMPCRIKTRSRERVQKRYITKVTRFGCVVRSVQSWMLVQKLRQSATYSPYQMCHIAFPFLLCPFFFNKKKDVSPFPKLGKRECSLSIHACFLVNHQREEKLSLIPNAVRRFHGSCLRFCSLCFHFLPFPFRLLVLVAATTC